MTDQQVLDGIDAAFAQCKRPGHFTDRMHCSECAEHDDTLLARDRLSLRLEDVGHESWDPICFITPEGFAYYLPALARFALAEPVPKLGWYGAQLAVHLRGNGPGNALVNHCNQQQRDAIARLLRHLIDTRSALADRFLGADALMDAYAIWS